MIIDKINDTINPTVIVKFVQNGEIIMLNNPQMINHLQHQSELDIMKTKLSGIPKDMYL